MYICRHHIELMYTCACLCILYCVESRPFDIVCAWYYTVCVHVCIVWMCVCAAACICFTTMIAVTSPLVKLCLFFSQAVLCLKPNCTSNDIIPPGPDECCGTCGCRYGGKLYSPGETFPSTDGCNTWWDILFYTCTGYIIMLKYACMIILSWTCTHIHMCSIPSVLVQKDMLHALKELVYQVSVINNHVCVYSTILYNIIQYVCMYAQHTNRKFI